MTITLAKTETKLLIEAAARGGTLHLPESIKPVTRDRLLGKLEAEGLIVAGGQYGAEPQLSPAGYRAVGLRAPRRGRAAVAVAPTHAEAGAGAFVATAGIANDAPPAGTKRALVAEMLGRQGGASLAELIAATGWLPHTTRAALSRLRSAGRMLTKSTRPDGKTAYRLEQALAAAQIGTSALSGGRRSRRAATEIAAAA